MKPQKIKLNRIHFSSNKNKGFDFSDTPTSKISDLNFKKEPNQTAILFTEGGDAVISYPVNIDGENHIVLEPDMTTLFFSMAQGTVSDLILYKDELLKKTNVASILNANIEDIKNSTFPFLALTSSFVIFLFSSIECFINSTLDKKFSITKGEGKVDDYDRILRHYKFYDKINKALNTQLSLDFKGLHLNEWKIIEEIKEFRDELIHLKPQQNTPIDYPQIINKSLNINYEECLKSVKLFINYYKPESLICHDDKC